MVKKRLYIIIVVAILIAFMTGCQGLQQYALQAQQNQNTPAVTETPLDTGALPTLPNNNGLIPLTVFTSYVEFTTPQISADGDMILYRHIKGFTDDVIAQNWRTGQQTVVQWPGEINGNPDFLWAPDSETVLFFVDNMGDENYGLYTSNISTGATKTILAGGSNNCYYISDDKQNNKEIYIAIFNFDTNRYDLYLMNYETGEKTLLLKNNGFITDYIFDDNGNLRIVTTNDDHAGKHVWVKNDIKNTDTSFSKNGWTQILSWNYEDAGSSGVWGIMPDEKSILYIDSSSNNTSTLYTYDLDTGKTNVIFNDPNYDISGTWTDISLNKVTAVSIYGQKNEWHVLDSSFQASFDMLSKNGENFEIIDSSNKDEDWIIGYVSDTKEEDYYVYDMAAKQETFLYNAQPDLGQYNFAATIPFQCVSGDGLKLEGYATFPSGADKKNLPTVILVHGGPWVRDTWEYNQEVQLLANRGYLVLQVNYRGSAGYGKDFMLAGDKEWGGKMHQDILDAVSYAIQQGWTDPDRVGVYGSSYGGYEALICAAFSSDVFKCAVDSFGPSDLTTFIQSIPPQWSVDYQDLIRAVGDPKTEADLLKKRSPLYYAGDVKIPVLIAQGGNDVRVPQQQSDQMVKALQDAGVSVTYMLFPDTGHGFNSDSDRKQFYSGMENFFAGNLGGKTDN